MFEVVVLARLLVKDVHHNVAVVKRDPFATGPTFNAQGFRAHGRKNHPLDLFGYGSYLSIIPSRNDNESVKGVLEFDEIKDHRINGDLFVGTFENYAQQGLDLVVKGPVKGDLVRGPVTQRSTPSVIAATAKGTAIEQNPTMAQ